MWVRGFIYSLLIGSITCSAQEQDSTYISFIPFNSEEYQAILQLYEDYPIQINTMNYEDLVETKVFTKKQCWGIRVYRIKYGEIRSKEELGLVLGFSDDFVELIYNVIDFSSKIPKSIIKYKGTQFYEQDLMQSRKYVNRHQLSNQGGFGKLNAVIVHRSQFGPKESIVGFLQLQPKCKALKAEMIIGHYNVRVGSGLLLGNSWNWNHPFHLQSNSSITNVRGVTNQNSSFFGSTFKSNFQKHEILFAVSHKEKEVVHVFNYQNNNNLLGFSITGLKNSKERNASFGGQIFRQQDHWKSTFDLAFDHNYNRAALFSFSGWTENGLEGKIELMHYDEYFDAPFSGATSGSGRVDNEKALLFLLKKAFGRFTLGIEHHVSHYINPTINYRKMRQEDVSGFYLQYDFEHTNIFQQIEFDRTKRLNESEALNHSVEVNFARLKSKSELVFNLREGVKSILGSILQSDEEMSGLGRSCYNRWVFSSKKVKVNYQLGAFHSKDFQTRSYHYIPQLRYSMNVRMYYGKGFYNVFSLKKDWKHLTGSLALFHQYFSRFNNQWNTFQHQFTAQFMLEWKIKKFSS
jgi:hypothetical protein